MLLTVIADCPCPALVRLTPKHRVLRFRRPAEAASSTRRDADQPNDAKLHCRHSKFAASSTLPWDHPRDSALGLKDQGCLAGVHRSLHLDRYWDRRPSAGLAVVNRMNLPKALYQ